MNYRLALPAALVATLALAMAPQQDEDRAAVIRAGQDYIDALYQAKPELIERSVRSDLRKLGFYRPAGADDYSLSPMTYEQLHALAGRWNQDGSRADEDTIQEIEVLDLMDTTAAIKVTAVWGVDHMQLGKFDGQWQIVNILWQSHPSQQ